MTIKLAENIPSYPYMSAVLCGIEALSLIADGKSLNEELNAFQDGANITSETPTSQVISILRDMISSYIQNIDGIIYVSEVAKSLRLDPNIVFSILLDLGLEIED